MFLLALVTQAQIKTPAPSPMQTLEQTVGLTDVTLKYSRPSQQHYLVLLSTL